MVIEDPSQLREGQILCPIDKRVPLVTHFEARILSLDFQIPILPGTPAELHVQSFELACQIVKLLGTGKKDHSERLNPRQITKHSVALLEIRAEKPICLELHSDHRALGRFSLRRQGCTIAVGIVTRIIS